MSVSGDDWDSLDLPSPNNIVSVDDILQYLVESVAYKSASPRIHHNTHPYASFRSHRAAHRGGLRSGQCFEPTVNQLQAILGHIPASCTARRSSEGGSAAPPLLDSCDVEGTLLMGAIECWTTP